MPTENVKFLSLLYPDYAAFSQLDFVRMLASGGKGDAWECAIQPSGRRVFVKELIDIAAGKFAKKGLLEDYCQRAAAIARVVNKQRLAIRLLALVCREKTEKLCVVTDFLEGEELEQWLKEGTCRPLEARILYSRMLAETFTKLHTSGFVHLDLKPRNLFVRTLAPESEGSRDCYVAGILDVDDCHIKTMPRVRATGDEAWASPEMIQHMELGKPVPDQKSDVFSLGLILAKILTGRIEFDKGDPLDLPALRVYNSGAKLKPLTAVNPELANYIGLPTSECGLSSKIDEVIPHMLASAPESRPRMEEVRAVLFNANHDPSLPVVKVFETGLTSNALGTGKEYYLAWEVRNALRVEIEPGIGLVVQNGKRSPIAPGKYTLRASGDGGTITRSLSVGPKIKSFELNKAKITSWSDVASTELRWEIEDAETVTIEPGIGSVAANGAINVDCNMAYTIRASGGGKEIVQSVGPMVYSPPSSSVPAKSKSGWEAL